MDTHLNIDIDLVYKEACQHFDKIDYYTTVFYIVRDGYEIRVDNLGEIYVDLSKDINQELKDIIYSDIRYILNQFRTQVENISYIINDELGYWI